MSASKRDRDVPPGILDEQRRTVTNKNTGEQITWEKYGYETKGEYSIGMIVCNPGGGPPLHYHTSYAERFTPIDGDAGVMVAGKKLNVTKGESVKVPIGTPHRFFNEGDKPVLIKGEVIPSHAGFEKSIYILFGLNNDGLADPKTGMPYSIVHTALVGDMGDMKFPGFRGGLMNYVGKILATYGRWTGVEDELLKKYWD